MPNSKGRFGAYGGVYVAETLIPALEELAKQYNLIRDNKNFLSEVSHDLETFVGRPSPLYFARRWSLELGGAKIYLKREDLNHTGAHKINNTVGQILLAKHMGKKRIIAETGAGQHGVATATVCARHGMECVIYMGEEDIRRQSLNVYRIKILGAKVVSVNSGTKTLKDAMNEAMRDWVTNVDDTYYIIGSVAGPHPYPKIVRDFNSIVGKEVLYQSKKQIGRNPDLLVACVGGGSNAMGLFFPFLGNSKVKMVGVEAGGLGLSSGKHAAPLNAGREGVLHGMRTYLMQDKKGQVLETHSISAGLDYPGVGPEHAWLKDIGRVNYTTANDEEALEAFRELTLVEGIMPALETAHALAYVKKVASSMSKRKVIVVNISGRGDKDINTVADIDGIKL
ncbi:uncharacterized protein METZ01_LOCUS101464 [marine metagenome]|uniref:tryptophan synthase n=1 Tax=marine metagenome TaxID=408172 RepID=A0A381W7T0_9ZZZZ